MMITETFLSLFLVMFIWYGVGVYMKRRHLPRGPIPYSYLGNIPQIISNGPFDAFGKLADKYGDIYTVTFPIGDAVILNTASLVRETKGGANQEDFAGRIPESIYPCREIFGTDMTMADYSPGYCFRRKVFISAMHLFGAGIDQASTRASHAVQTAIEEIEREPGQPFSPKDIFQRAILVQIWEWITSEKVALNDPTIKRLCEFSTLVSKQALLSKTYQLFPFLRYLPTPVAKEIKRAKEIKKSIFPPQYQAHEETYTPGNVRDLTDSFICAFEKEIAKETSKDIGSKDAIPGMMTNLANAGSDTTSTSLAWLFLYIVLNPDVQRRIHEELDIVVGKDRIPNWKDAQNMPYLQATLCEVQRASGMIGLVATNATRDTTIGGYDIPRGTTIGVNFPKLHKNERDWPEPDKFKPERFLDPDGKFVGWKKLHGFLPFGIGRRECPGQFLGQMMMFSFASVLLNHYKIQLPEGAKTPTTEVSTSQLVARPNDFLVVAKPRVEVP